MNLFKVFEHHLTVSRRVKSENHGSKWPEQTAEPLRHPRIHMTTFNRLATQSLENCTIGRNEGRIRSQAQAFELRRGIGYAPSGGDGYRDACLLCRPERPRIAGTHGACRAFK
jgi:hypothetical protein